jgi:beta-lactam-binding protein with PASTA domain
VSPMAELPEVSVPSFVGMNVVAAYRTALLAGVTIVDHDPAAVLGLSGVICRQRPAAGSVIGPGDDVALWLQRRTDDPRGHRLGVD